METKNIIYIVAISLAVGTYAGIKLAKPTTIVKTEVVEKQVEHEKVVTQVHEVARPDGSRETTTTITADKDIQTDLTASQTLTVATVKQWYVRGDYSVLGAGGYELGLGRLILPNIYLDIAVSSSLELDNKQLKLGVLWTF
jgi:hypothetical protein